MTAFQRVTTFFDVQNFYNSSKQAFPDTSDGYHPKDLATHIAKRLGWHLTQTQFHTATPDQKRDQIFAKLWHRRLPLISPNRYKTTPHIVRFGELGRGH